MGPRAVISTAASPSALPASRLASRRESAIGRPALGNAEGGDRPAPAVLEEAEQPRLEDLGGAGRQRRAAGVGGNRPGRRRPPAAEPVVDDRVKRTVSPTRKVA